MATRGAPPRTRTRAVVANAAALCRHRGSEPVHRHGGDVPHFRKSLHSAFLVLGSLVPRYLGQISDLGLPIPTKTALRATNYLPRHDFHTPTWYQVCHFWELGAKHHHLYVILSLETFPDSRLMDHNSSVGHACPQEAFVTQISAAQTLLWHCGCGWYLGTSWYLVPGWAETTTRVYLDSNLSYQVPTR